MSDLQTLATIDHPQTGALAVVRNPKTRKLNVVRADGSIALRLKGVDEAAFVAHQWGAHGAVNSGVNKAFDKALEAL